MVEKSPKVGMHFKQFFKLVCHMSLLLTISLKPGFQTTVFCNPLDCRCICAHELQFIGMHHRNADQAWVILTVISPSKYNCKMWCSILESFAKQQQAMLITFSLQSFQICSNLLLYHFENETHKLCVSFQCRVLRFVFFLWAFFLQK